MMTAPEVVILLSPFVPPPLTLALWVAFYTAGVASVRSGVERIFDTVRPFMPKF